MINLGQDNGPIDRVQYTVDAAKRQLNSQVINPAPGVAVQPVLPVAQNVVLVKAQYGIDPTDTNIISAATAPAGFWTSAVPAAANPANTTGVDYSCNNSSNDALFANCNFGKNATGPRRRGPADRFNPHRQGHAHRRRRAQRGVRQGSRRWSASRRNTSSTAPPTPTRPARAASRSTAAAGGVLADGYRHRIYETTIPLRNSIWNK